MKNFEDKSSKGKLDRRSFLGVTAAATTATIVGGLALPANAKSNTQAPKNGRRKLGTLEVSNVGLGVQNMSRKYETTVPYRPEMINIIRAAYDHGVTFFDTAEA